MYISRILPSLLLLRMIAGRRAALLPAGVAPSADTYTCIYIYIYIWFSLSLSIYIYIYMNTYICIYSRDLGA